MKDVLSLTRAITEVEFYSEMFEKWGEEKNILFVSPQLSGRHLYKTILPFFCLVNPNVATAITSLKRYDYKKQLLDFQIDLNDEMVDWADIIVFPFTTQPLVEELYARIREIKPETKIFFSVDFNFYELTQNHPFKEIFSDESVINDVESNMYFSDMVLVTNSNLLNYIINKINTLQETKFKDVQGYMSIASLPLFIDRETVLKNVDYETENPKNVTVDVKKEEPVIEQKDTNVAEVKKETIEQPKTLEVIHTKDVKSLLEKITEAEEKVKQKELEKKEEESKKKDENFKAHQEQKDEKNKQKEIPKAKNVTKVKKEKTTKNGKHTATTTVNTTTEKPKRGRPKSSSKPKKGKSKRRGRPKKRG